jgi:ferredoxin-NADP reductase
MSNTMQRMDVRVHALRAEGCEAISLDLRALNGEALPAFQAGSHIDVEIPAAQGTLLRQYSLSNDAGESHRYVIGVARDAASRGGSAALHDRVRVGDVLRIGAPRNQFALHEQAPHSVLIAGGIGITPLLAMARRLNALRQGWTLYQCVRAPSRAAFVEELWALQAASEGRGRVVSVFDGAPGASMLDLAETVRAAPAASHFYCCGPAPMLQAFMTATAALPREQVHVEWFSAAPAPAAIADAAPAEGFTVRLQRQGITVQVPPDKSILDSLLAAGASVDYACCEGLCGSCEARVLEGTPDHQDTIFAYQSPAPLDRIMICVSRCKGPELVLDL